jgi:hypothetical protein
MTHVCDPSSDPRGGLVTLARVGRALLASMDGRVPVTTEFDDCQKCRNLFAITMSATAAIFATTINPGAQMFYELQLEAVEAAIDRGETETPADGFF